MTSGPAFRTLEDFVFVTLRKDIISHRIEAGQTLTLNDLEAMMGVSRTPIRQALRRLASAGFVTVLPHSSVQVKRLDTKEAVELYSIRIQLEGMAASLSAKKLSDKDIELLEEELKRSESAYKSGNIEDAIDLNRRFHERLYAGCDMPRLLEMIRDLSALCERYRIVELREANDNDRSLESHRLLFLAARNRDAKEVARLTREHLIGALNAVKSYFAEKEESKKSENDNG